METFRISVLLGFFFVSILFLLLSFVVCIFCTYLFSCCKHSPFRAAQKLKLLGENEYWLIYNWLIEWVVVIWNFCHIVIVWTKLTNETLYVPNIQIHSFRIFIFSSAYRRTNCSIFRNFHRTKIESVDRIAFLSLERSRNVSIHQWKVCVNTHATVLYESINLEDIFVTYIYA